jgi:hypothetical protein
MGLEERRANQPNFLDISSPVSFDVENEMEEDKRATKSIKKLIGSTSTPADAIAATRVPATPSTSARLIGALLTRWNAVINNNNNNNSFARTTPETTTTKRGQNAIVRIIDGESVLVNTTRGEGGGMNMKDEVNVALILKELPTHLIALLMADEETEARQWQKQTVMARNNGENDESSFDFRQYVANGLDVVKRVVSMRSLRNVKHYFEKIGYDPTPAVLDVVLCAVRRVAMTETTSFLGKTSDSNDNLKLKCEIMKTCAEIVTEIWEQDLVKCAAELATYPMAMTHKKNNKKGKEKGEESMLMSFYDAAYSMAREVYASIDDENWKNETKEFRAFLDIFASFAFNREVVEYAHQCGGKEKTMRMVRLALVLLQYTPGDNSVYGDTALWERLWFAAKGSVCLRMICTADLCNGSGETLYDKYLHDAAQKSSDDFEMAANIVARDSLKLATECAAVAFVQALDSMYPKYNAPAFFGSFTMIGSGDSMKWRVFASLARCCEVLCEDSEVRDAIISALIVPLAKFMSNIVRGRSGDMSTKIDVEPQGTFFVIFEDVRTRGVTQKATETVKLAWMFIYGTISSAQAAPFMGSKSFGKEFSRVISNTSSENPEVYGGLNTAKHVCELLNELHNSAKSLVGAENASLFEAFLAEL